MYKRLTGQVGAAALTEISTELGAAFQSRKHEGTVKPLRCRASGLLAAPVLFLRPAALRACLLTF